MRIFVMFFCILFVGTADAFFRCQNPDGSISFSDSPCGTRDEGVDLERERLHQETLQARQREEQERLAALRRERDAQLREVRQRKQRFIQQYPRLIQEGAFPSYTAEKYPEIVAEYEAQLLAIEQAQLDAARLTLNSQQCDQITRVELDPEHSSAEHFSLLIRCVNEKLFRLDNKEIGNRVVPKALEEEEEKSEE